MADKGLCTFLIASILYLPALKAQTLDCDFETGYCGWVTPSISIGNWTHDRIKSPSPTTGPSTGHTSEDPNFFIYLYAENFKDQSGKPSGNCVLDSPDFNTGTQGGCFRFFYHMFGSGVGNLTVAVIQDGNTNLKWDRYGQQGNWTCGSVEFGTNKTNLKIRITATTGPNVLGDIALDDFKYYDQQCGQDSDVCNNGTVTTPATVTETSTRVDTSSPLTGTTIKAVESTTAETEPDNSWVLYVAVIPVGILIIGAIIAFAVYKLKKSPERKYYNTSTDNPEHQDEPMEEEYAELDEVNMNDNDDVGYTLPASNGSVPSDIKQRFAQNTGNENGALPNYLPMRNTKKNKDEDTESEHSYMETVPGPVQNEARPSNTKVSNEVQTRQSNDRFKNPGAAFDTDGSIHRGNTERFNRGFVPDDSNGRRGVGEEGRASTAPDYEEEDNPPPPKCGPTSLYITAVDE